MRKINRRSRCVAVTADRSARPLLVFLVASLMTVLGIVAADIHRDMLRSHHVVISGESVDGHFFGP